MHFTNTFKYELTKCIILDANRWRFRSEAYQYSVDLINILVLHEKVHFEKKSADDKKNMTKLPSMQS